MVQGAGLIHAEGERGKSDCFKNTSYPSRSFRGPETQGLPRMAKRRGKSMATLMPMRGVMRTSGAG